MESVYERCLKYELQINGYHVLQQVAVPLSYKGIAYSATTWSLGKWYCIGRIKGHRKYTARPWSAITHLYEIAKKATGLIDKFFHG